MDFIQDSRMLAEEETMIRATILIELEALAKNEESCWKQNSRVLWLKKGDKNTKFFQRMATTHRRLNTIDRLVIGGEEIKEPEEIKEHITDFYKKLYTKSENWRPPFEMVDCPRITKNARTLFRG